jgi:hypothetical protein
MKTGRLIGVAVSRLVRCLHLPIDSYGRHMPLSCEFGMQAHCKNMESKPIEETEAEPAERIAREDMEIQEEVTRLTRPSS